MTREEAIEVIKEYSHTPEEMEALAVLIPELAETESERIRKWLLKCVKNMSDVNFVDVEREDVFAWLEKQKGQKPEEWKSTESIYDKEVLEENLEKIENMTVKEIRQGLREGYGFFIFGDSQWAILESDNSAEWSEEDEKMRKNILCVLESFVSNTGCESSPSLIASYHTYCQEIDWLKSLRPQPKIEWSEEDQLNLNWVIAILNGEPCELDIQLESLIYWLKSLPMRCPKSSDNWKPSEEQMEAFRSYIKDFQDRAEAAVGGWNNFDVMIRLFEQLKKL